MYLNDYIEANAVIEGEHRYLLKRIWDIEKPMLTYIMLNPSTADGKKFIKYL